MFFKNKNYFFVFEVEKVEKDKSIPKPIMKYIKKYLWRRGKTVKYFEPFSNTKLNTSYVVIGSVEVKGKANRNVLIFILELYAQLKEPEKHQVTNDFKKVTKKIKGTSISIYKFKNFK